MKMKNPMRQKVSKNKLHEIQASDSWREINLDLFVGAKREKSSTKEVEMDIAEH